MSTARRQRLQLSRLERLMDVVFAIIIWRLFMLLPRPQGDEIEWDSVAAMFVAEWLTFAVVVVGVIIVIVFWLQNNVLFGYLERTDVRHTAIAIFQLFFLLFFLYAIGIGVRAGAADDTRLLESVAAMLVGLVSHLGWRYAIYNGRLLHSSASPEDVQAVTRQTLAEPLTAMFTIPFAFLGPLLWELSWFLYPLLRRLLGSRTR